MKKKYRIFANMTISVSTIVEAENKEAAFDIAEARGVQSLPACAKGNINKTWCHSGELDGEPDHDTFKVEEE